MHRPESRGSLLGKVLSVLVTLYVTLPVGWAFFAWFDHKETETLLVQLGSTVVLLIGFVVAFGKGGLETTQSRIRRVSASMVAGVPVGLCIVGLVAAVSELPGIYQVSDDVLDLALPEAWILSAVVLSVWPSSATCRRAIYTVWARAIAACGAVSLVAGVVILPVAEARDTFMAGLGAMLAIGFGGLAIYWRDSRHVGRSQRSDVMTTQCEARHELEPCGAFLSCASVGGKGFPR